jgi:ADP-ribose pyrophosphatase
MSAKVMNRTTLHRGRVFELHRENVALPNGVIVDFDVVRHPGASAVVPILGQENVVLLKQYRHAIGDFIWEIPAGTLNAGETPLQCAKRELCEETGLMAQVFEKIGEVTPLPGYADERIHLFVAVDLEAAEQSLDEDEMLDVHEVGLNHAIEMIYKGSIQDGKTIAGLFLAYRWMKDRQNVLCRTESERAGR